MNRYLCRVSDPNKTKLHCISNFQSQKGNIMGVLSCIKGPPKAPKDGGRFSETGAPSEEEKLEKLLQDLSGSWVPVNEESESLSKVLQLQGVGWIKRKVAENLLPTQRIVTDGKKVKILTTNGPFTTNEVDVIVNSKKTSVAKGHYGEEISKADMVETPSNLKTFCGENSNALKVTFELPSGDVRRVYHTIHKSDENKKVMLVVFEKAENGQTASSILVAQRESDNDDNNNINDVEDKNRAENVKEAPEQGQKFDQDEFKIEDVLQLVGSWATIPEESESKDPVLELQGINWMKRKIANSMMPNQSIKIDKSQKKIEITTKTGPVTTNAEGIIGGEPGNAGSSAADGKAPASSMTVQVSATRVPKHMAHIAKGWCVQLEFRLPNGDKRLVIHGIHKDDENKKIMSMGYTRAKDKKSATVLLVAKRT